VATVYVVHRLAKEIFSDEEITGWAALLMAIEPLSIFYTSQRLTENSYTLVLFSSLLTFYRDRLVWGCVLFVVSLLIRPSLDLLGPVLVVAFGIYHNGAFRLAGSARRLAIYGLVYVILFAPWWWHNWQKYGRFVHLNVGDGVVLRVENNPWFAEYGLWDKAGFWSRTRPVFDEYRHVADPVARNNAYRRSAIQFIKEDTVRYGFAPKVFLNDAFCIQNRTF